MALEDFYFMSKHMSLKSNRYIKRGLVKAFLKCLFKRVSLVMIISVQGVTGCQSPRSVILRIEMNSLSPGHKRVFSLAG